MIALLRRATKLPSDPDPALAGIGLAVLEKLAVEAGDQPRIRPDRDLSARVDARRVARRARAVDGVAQSRALGGDCVAKLFSRPN